MEKLLSVEFEAIKPEQFLPLLGTVMSDPKEIMWGYVINSIVWGGAKTVHIAPFPKKGILVISDDGSGLDQDGLSELPKRIADSFGKTLTGKQTKAQGKGIGMYAYQAIASDLDVYSHTKTSSVALLSLNRENKLSADLYKSENKKDLPAHIKMVANQGTTVVLRGVEAKTFSVLTGRKIEDYLQRKARQLLLTRAVDFRVGQKDGKLKKVVPPVIKGGLLEIPTETKVTIEGSLGKVEFPIQLALYISYPDEAGESVLLVDGSGSTVLNDISSLSCFSHHPWSDGAVKGHIKCDFLEQDISRETVIDDYNLQLFCETISAFEETIKEQVAVFRAGHRSRKKQKLFKEINQITQSILARLDEVFLKTSRNIPPTGLHGPHAKYEPTDKKPTDKKPPKGGSVKENSFEGFIWQEAPLASGQHFDYNVTTNELTVNNEHDDYKSAKDLRRYLVPISVFAAVQFVNTSPEGILMITPQEMSDTLLSSMYIMEEML